MRAWELALPLLTGCAATAGGGEGPQTVPHPNMTAPGDPQIPALIATAPPSVSTATGAVTLGITPNDVEMLCQQHGGRSMRIVMANRVSINCDAPSGDLSNVLVGFCHEKDSKRACYVVETSDEIPAERATALAERLAQQFKSTYGAPLASTPKEEIWPWLDTGRVHLSWDLVAARTRVRAFHANAEGVKAISTLPEFPHEIAGFAFGATTLEAGNNCVAKSGLFLDTARMHDANPQSIAPMFACANPRVELPFELQTVLGVLCDGHVCELELALGGSFEAAVTGIEGKYGPSLSANEPGKCKAQAKRNMWVWSVAGQVQGVLRLTDDCALVLYYDDAEGWALRQGERQRRLQNF